MPDEIPTSERLARALEERHNPRLAGMVKRAREGYYDDYGPRPMPIAELVRDLTQNGEHELAQRAKDGEFDATKAESDAWSRSPEGRAAFKEFAATTGKAPSSSQIAIETMVAYRDRLPYVVLKWGAEACQMTPADAVEHATRIIEASQAAITDAFLMAFLAEKLELNERMAAAAVAEFRGYRKALEERGHA
jgi:hypothetical protein